MINKVGQLCSLLENILAIGTIGKWGSGCKWLAKMGFGFEHLSTAHLEEHT